MKSSISCDGAAHRLLLIAPRKSITTSEGDQSVALKYQCPLICQLLLDSCNHLFSLYHLDLHSTSEGSIE